VVSGQDFTVPVANVPVQSVGIYLPGQSTGGTVGLCRLAFRHLHRLTLITQKA
jgi:hypothetical protein